MARRGAANAVKLLPLSGHRGHGRTCYGLDPVANDPIRHRAPKIVHLTGAGVFQVWNFDSFTALL
jgi:hypothetical protein